MMMSSKSHVTLITILVFLKNLIQCHTYAKFHNQGLTGSGFMMEEQGGRLSSSPGLFNVKKPRLVRVNDLNISMSFKQIIMRFQLIQCFILFFFCFSLFCACGICFGVEKTYQNICFLILQYSTIREYPKSKIKTKCIKIQVQYNSRCKEPAEDWSAFSSGTFSQ